ncbi:hypothetical protein FSP39_022739 [Pinctada imbricata]|uniref:Uncharacterized protein n=1 Tax=Pinctada imbricata TaxID=66713 RepID=A0AA88XU84_PINIB|nr:hypothetical protein FSP39_022739 [Pinctada imbricata]
MASPQNTSDVIAQSRSVLFEELSGTEVTLENVYALVQRLGTTLNDSISKLGNSVNSRLASLENAITKIDDVFAEVTKVSTRVHSLEENMSDMNQKYIELQQNLEGVSNIFDEVRNKSLQTEKEVKELKKKISLQEAEFQKLQKESIEKLDRMVESQDEIKEQVLDLKCRSMKYNLVFSGISERRNENTEEILRSFIVEELGIDEYLDFTNVHRFGSGARPGEVGKPRPIVARFIYQKDLSSVLANAKYLRGKPYGINRQFPQEVEQARRSLDPVMKTMRAEGKKVKMVRDMLFVNDILYVPPEAAESVSPAVGGSTPTRTSPMENRYGSTPRRPTKRFRRGPTPDRYAS